MTRDADERLLLELVRGNATLEEITAEGFSKWEIDAARARVERDDEDSFPSPGQEDVVTSASAPTSSSVVTAAGAG
jgi:hypothetical protein